uniref:Uncharacterized protein n=1 Tax=Arundo donax TaxID=35708 RepID=A0A0A8ZGG0_ARUDO
MGSQTLITCCGDGEILSWLHFILGFALL